MCNIINAYVHSVTDYDIDMCTVQTEVRLCKMQSLIDRFLINYYFPAIVRKIRKKNYQSVLISININEIRNNCNDVSLKERSDYVLLKNLFKSHSLSPLPFSAFSDRTKNKSMPMLFVLRNSAASYEISIEYHGRRLWNDFPKDWALNDMSYPGFCVKNKE
jgi:hypothetical protein